ncbi:MAG: tRNA (adenosine(37)-N6)-dimethylallyltransferase MiaA [Treponema sp.]
MAQIAKNTSHTEAYNCAVILGATATGKTALAVRLAHLKSGEIISADSRQVYRGLDIGSGKDIHEYGTIPYHLIDICDLNDEFTVFHFQKAVYNLFPTLLQKNTLPIIAGGTGLYLDSILRCYQLIAVPENPALRAELADKPLKELQQLLLTLKPEIHNTTDLEQPARIIRAIEISLYNKTHPQTLAALSNAVPHIVPKVYRIFFDRPILRQRIHQRLIARLELGMLEETEQLHTKGYTWEQLENLGLEYRYTAQYLQGKIADKETFIQTLYHAICQFAKRQETWFRRMERHGISITLLNGETLQQRTTEDIFADLGIY